MCVCVSLSLSFSVFFPLSVFSLLSLSPKCLQFLIPSYTNDFILHTRLWTGWRPGGQPEAALGLYRGALLQQPGAGSTALEPDDAGGLRQSGRHVAQLLPSGAVSLWQW